MVARIAFDGIAIHHELVVEARFTRHGHLHHGTAPKHAHIKKITRFYKRKLHAAIISYPSVSVRKISRE